MQPNTNREYGIDIARILAMFFVCVLHMGAWHGGGVKYAPTTGDYTAAVLFWSLAFVGVNLFMMISGYLGICRIWKFKSLFRLWLQVVFYLMGGFLIVYLQTGSCLRADLLFNKLFPIPFANAYWYFTAYAGAFFFFPYLNKGFLVLTKQEREKLLLTLFVVICLFGLFNKHVWGGLNAVWMLVMYLAGAYLKLHPLQLRARHLLLIYIAGSLIGGALFMLDEHLKMHTAHDIPIPGLSYTSPFVVCASVACFALCTRLQPQAPWLRKAIVAVAPLTFAVYLIQSHPMLAAYIHYFCRISSRYTHYHWWHTPVLAILLFIVCIGIDYLRLRLFTIIGHLFSRKAHEERT